MNYELEFLYIILNYFLNYSESVPDWIRQQATPPPRPPPPTPPPPAPAPAAPQWPAGQAQWSQNAEFWQNQATNEPPPGVF